MRFAIDNGDRVRGLALVDTHGLHRLRPSPAFSLTLVNFLARPTAGSRDRFFRQCFVDMPGLHEQLGPLWAPLGKLNEAANIPFRSGTLRLSCIQRCSIFAHGDYLLALSLGQCRSL